MDWRDAWVLPAGSSFPLACFYFIIYSTNLAWKNDFQVAIQLVPMIQWTKYPQVKSITLRDFTIPLEGRSSGLFTLRVYWKGDHPLNPWMLRRPPKIPPKPGSWYEALVVPGTFLISKRKISSGYGITDAQNLEASFNFKEQNCPHGCAERCKAEWLGNGNVQWLEYDY